MVPENPRVTGAQAVLVTRWGPLAKTVPAIKWAGIRREKRVEAEDFSQERAGNTPQDPQ